jgi:MFS family permease
VAHGDYGREEAGHRSRWSVLYALGLQIFHDKGLLVFAASAALFFLGSAAVLPIAVNELAKHGNAVGLWLSASIVVPQIVVGSLAPWIGRTADRWGRRPVLLLGFVALPIRALLFASMPGPYVLILVQALDGLSGAVFGVMVALVAADLTRRIGCLNLAMGTINLAISLGAALSTTLAGAIAGAWGDQAAFLSLAGAGCCAASLVWLIMPETRPPGIVTLTDDRRIWARNQKDNRVHAGVWAHVSSLQTLKAVAPPARYALTFIRWRRG